MTWPIIRMTRATGQTNWPIARVKRTTSPSTRRTGHLSRATGHFCWPIGQVGWTVGQQTRTLPARVHSSPATGPGEAAAGYALQPAICIDSRTDFTLGWFSSKCLRRMARAFLKLAQAAARSPSSLQMCARLL